jgi:hypothetical protein
VRLELDVIREFLLYALGTEATHVQHLMSHECIHLTHSTWNPIGHVKNQERRALNALDEIRVLT